MNDRSKSLDAGTIVLLSPGEGATRDAIIQGVQLRHSERLAVVETAREAVSAVRASPSLVLFPIAAERVDGMQIEQALRASNPAVPLIAFGPAVRASTVCHLLGAGVAAYLDEPITSEQVALELQSLAHGASPLRVALRASVGVRDLKDVQRFVRFTMCAEALERVSGSRRGAARLLGVDRRAVQKLVEQMEDEDGFELPDDWPAVVGLREGAIS